MKERGGITVVYVLCDQSCLPKDSGQDRGVKSDTHDPLASDGAICHDKVILEDVRDCKEEEYRVKDGVEGPTPECLDVELLVERGSKVNVRRYPLVIHNL